MTSRSLRPPPATNNSSATSDRWTVFDSLASKAPVHTGPVPEDTRREDLRHPQAQVGTHSDGSASPIRSTPTPAAQQAPAALPQVKTADGLVELVRVAGGRSAIEECFRSAKTRLASTITRFGDTPPGTGTSPVHGRDRLPDDLAPRYGKRTAQPASNRVAAPGSRPRVGIDLRFFLCQRDTATVQPNCPFDPSFARTPPALVVMAARPSGANAMSLRSQASNCRCSNKERTVKFRCSRIRPRNR